MRLHALIRIIFTFTFCVERHFCSFPRFLHSYFILSRVCTRYFHCIPPFFTSVRSYFIYSLANLYSNYFYVYHVISLFLCFFFLFPAFIFHICVCTGLFESFLRLPGLFHIVSLHFNVFPLSRSYFILTRFSRLFLSFFRLPALFQVISTFFLYCVHI